MSKLKFGLGAAAVVVAVGVAWWQSTGAQPGGQAAGPNAASRTSSAGQAAAGGCHLERGQRHRFSYRSQTHYQLTAQFPGVAADQVPTQAGETELSGALSFEVIAASPSGPAVVLGRLADANDAARQQVGAALESPFLLELNGRCEVTRFARHKETARATARVQAVVAHDLAFAVPQGAGPEEATFMTTVGVMRALVLRGNEADEIVRKHLGYTTRWSTHMANVDVVDGEVSVKRGASGWFDSLQGAEELRGGSVQFSKTEWRVGAMPVDAAALAQASRALTDYVWENPLAALPEEEKFSTSSTAQEHERRVEKMKDVPWDTALDRFTVLLTSGANINDQWRDMAAYLDAHPDKVGEYVEFITDDAFPAGFKAPAFLALGQARTPVAREALLGVYRERANNSADRMRSSLALVTRADVGAPLAKELKAEALRAGADDSEKGVSRQAVLHLGILAGTRPAQADVAQEAMGLVQQLNGNAQTPEDWSVLCGLVGNMAEGTLLPTIEQWSRLPDPDARKQVPHALRRYKVDRANPLLVDWVARETDADVKRELYHVIHHMHVDANRPVDERIMREALKHLKEQPLVLTRQSLLHILAPFIGSHPEVREAFKAQLKLELEERSGLFSLVAESLPAASMYEALATIPSLRGQFGGGLAPVVPPPVRPLEEQVPPSALKLPEARGDSAPATGGTP